jgi:hypothetical protein
MDAEAFALVREMADGVPSATQRITNTLMRRQRMASVVPARVETLLERKGWANHPKR